MSDEQTMLADEPPVIDWASLDVCALWASPLDAFSCCVDQTATNTDKMEWALAQASDILYHLSGDRFPGICQATVRPPRSSYVSCWYPLPWSFPSDDGSVRLSSVRLAGYPVQEILEVKIDGEVLDPSEYTVYRRRELVRGADANGRAQRWPASQRMDIFTEDQGFWVTYKYGVNPPVSGVSAAAQLACEIAKLCPGDDGSDSSSDCALPSGTVRISRQGITIDSQALGVWLIGQMKTGLPLVDAFLSVNGQPRATGPRRVAISVPEMDPWPVRID